MRVLEVVVRFHPYVGGVENTVYHLGRRLAARGHEVRVVCADEPAGSPSRVEGIDVVRLPYAGKVGNTNLSLGLRAALLRERPDVIHTHMPTAWFTDFAAVAARRLRVPLVLSYNNDLIGKGAKGVLAHVYNRFLLPRLFAATDRIVVSNPLYARNSPYLTEGDPKVMHIPWGVDETAFAPADQSPSGPAHEPPFVLGFLSLLDPHHRYKGLEVLLKALAERKDLPVRLKVGGAGEEQGYYRGLAESLGIADRVDFLGFVPHAALADFFRSCHVFVLPSTDGRQEGFGLVLLEAMSCARPVLTTPVVGMAGDIERARAGVLVPPGDSTALAEALAGLLADGSELAAMGERGRRLVEERYTWERVAEAYERLFEELRRGGPHPRPLSHPHSPPPGRGESGTIKP